MGPTTGATADADPAHRQVVQLEDVQRRCRPATRAYRDMLTARRRSCRSFAGDTAAAAAAR